MNTQRLVGSFPELLGVPSSLSFGVALGGGVEPVVEEAGAKGGQSLGRRPLNTALYCSMKNGPSQPSPWVPSPDSVLPLGCKVGDAAFWEWVVQPPPHSLNS